MENQTQKIRNQIKSTGWRKSKATINLEAAELKEQQAIIRLNIEKLKAKNALTKLAEAKLAAEKEAKPTEKKQIEIAEANLAVERTKVAQIKAIIALDNAKKDIEKAIEQRKREIKKNNKRLKKHYMQTPKGQAYWNDRIQKAHEKYWLKKGKNPDSKIRGKYKTKDKKMNGKTVNNFNNKQTILETEQTKIVDKKQIKIPIATISNPNFSRESVIVSQKLKQTCANSQQLIPAFEQPGSSKSWWTTNSVDKNKPDYNPKSNKECYVEKDVNSNCEQTVNSHAELINTSESIHHSTKKSSEKVNSNNVNNQLPPKWARYFKWKWEQNTKTKNHSLSKLLENSTLTTSKNDSLITSTVNSQTSFSTKKSKIEEEDTSFQAHLKFQEIVHQKCSEVIASEGGTYRQANKTVKVNANSKESNPFKTHLVSQQRVEEVCGRIIREQKITLLSTLDQEITAPSFNKNKDNAKDSVKEYKNKNQEFEFS